MQYSVQRADSVRDMEECSTVCRELIQTGYGGMQYSVHRADSAGIWRNAVQCAES